MACVIRCHLGRVERGLCQQLPAKAGSLCLNPASRVVHHRPIDCGPAASYKTMAAMDAPTLNLLPSGGLPARTFKTQCFNVQTVLSTASGRVPSAHLCVFYHERRYMAIERKKLAARIRNVQPILARLFASSAWLKPAVSTRRPL